MSGTVLCVDADSNLCEILAKALSGAGYRVVTASDGEAALALAIEDPPDVALLDLMLPKRDGFSVLEAIRGQDVPLRDLPAILLSSCSPTPEYKGRAEALGASALLTKPVPLERLLSLVASLVGEVKREGESNDVGERLGGGEVRGELTDVSFPELLHHLHGLRATGVLCLQSGQKKKWIQLREGFPVAVRSNLVAECLGNFLVRSGRISQAQAAESIKRLGQGRLQGEILVAMDVMSEAQVTACLRAQAEEKLFEVFSWDAGDFHFEMGKHLPRANTLGVKRSPANLILHGVRRRFPWPRIEAFLGANAERCPVLAESPFYRFQEIQLDADQQQLVASLDGTRPLSDFLASGEEVARTLYALLATGLLELRTARRGGAGAPRPVLQVDSAANDDSRRAQLAGMAERFRSGSPYEILGVGARANDQQIRDAYARISESAHPDRVGGASDTVKRLAEEVFQHVTQAYEILSDPQRRQQYDSDAKRDAREAALREEGRRALDAEVQFQKGEASLRSHEHQAALAYFGKALELYPDEGEYHAHYGWALHLCHPEDPAITAEALEHVERGIKLAAHREKPYLYLGRILMTVERVREAEKMFARAVQIQPDCVEALRELRLLKQRREKGKGFIRRLLRR